MSPSPIKLQSRHQQQRLQQHAITHRPTLLRRKPGGSNSVKTPPSAMPRIPTTARVPSSDVLSAQPCNKRGGDSRQPAIPSRDAWRCHLDSRPFRERPLSVPTRECPDRRLLGCTGTAACLDTFRTFGNPWLGEYVSMALCQSAKSDQSATQRPLQTARSVSSVRIPQRLCLCGTHQTPLALQSNRHSRHKHSHVVPLLLVCVWLHAGRWHNRTPRAPAIP